jgi:methionine sulfoxide reductase heme-binding subunit
MDLAGTLNGWLRRVPAWPLYVLAPLPPIWFLWLGLTGGLGAEPINALERELGLLALQVLVVSLAVTPIRRFLGLNLIRFRRALGLIGFFYVALHLLVWVALDVQSLERIWADVVKRPYITVGMAGFVLLIPLALTSTDGMVRRLGAARWRQLHRLVYPAVLLGGIHNVMVAKVWEIDRLAWLAAILVLLALRLRVPNRAGQSRGSVA